MPDVPIVPDPPIVKIPALTVVFPLYEFIPVKTISATPFFTTLVFPLERIVPLKLPAAA